MNNHTEETERIIQVYKQRDTLGSESLYSWELPVNHYYEFRHRSSMAMQFKRYGFTQLNDLKVLDVGCGDGSWLRTLGEWGVLHPNLYGTELLSDRLIKAMQLSSKINYERVDSYILPFPDQFFDVVTANVVFSSILEESYRQHLAEEIKRVCKNKGIILIYDFRISDPRNKQNMRIGKTEIIKLFGGYSIKSIPVLLFPPLARLLSRISVFAVFALETFLPFLCSHSIFSIKREAR